MPEEAKQARAGPDMHVQARVHRVGRGRPGGGLADDALSIINPARNFRDAVVVVAVVVVVDARSRRLVSKQVGSQRISGRLI